MQHYNPFSLEGKTILVIGASSGIGREIALECGKMGAKLIVCARSKDKLDALAEEIGKESCSVMVADVTNPTDIENLVDAIPAVDGLVISAGKGLALPIQFCTKEKFEDIFNLDFFAYTEITRLIYKKKKINKSGSIVFIGSVAGGFHNVAGRSVYGSAKSALNSFMRYAAIEFAGRKIRVNSINPGMIRTNLNANIVSEEDMQKDILNYPLKRYGEVTDIAPSAIYLLSDASSWMTGQAIVIDGGVSI